MDLTTREFTVESEARMEIEPITHRVDAALDETDAKEGLVAIDTAHTTAAVGTNEAEERLYRDILERLTDLVPPEDWYFHDQIHVDSGTQRNAWAHIVTTMLSGPVLLVLEDGELRLGTYEEVLFFEFDGPRERTVRVTALD